MDTKTRCSLAEEVLIYLNKGGLKFHLVTRNGIPEHSWPLLSHLHLPQTIVQDIPISQVHGQSHGCFYIQNQAVLRFICLKYILQFVQITISA